MTDDANDTGSKPGKWRWTRVLLAGSLLLNLLFAGYLAGRMFHHGGGPHGAGLTLYHVAEEMSPEARQVIQAVMAEHRDEIRAGMRALRAEKLALRELMTAETFDAAAVDAVFSRIRTINSALQEATHDATVEIGNRLSAEDRRQLNLEWRRLKGKGGKYGKTYKDHWRMLDDDGNRRSPEN